MALKEVLPGALEDVLPKAIAKAQVPFTQLATRVATF
jgi:hypothetical protein